MAFGKRISYFRKRNRLTAKALGMFLGFPKNSADVRIAQYEGEKRRPKVKVFKALAEALGVSPQALNVPDIDSLTGIMHTLFVLEDIYGLTVSESNGRPHLSFLNHVEPEGEESLFSHLAEWCDVKKDLLYGRITKTEYDDWRYNYPGIKRKKSGSTVEYTPMEELLG